MGKGMVIGRDILVRVVAVVALICMLVSCGVVAFTGRRQMLLFSDSEIIALSEQSYAEFIGSAKVSDRELDTNMLTEVGRRMTSALESYLVATGQSSALQGLVWEFSLVESNEVNAFCLPSGRIVFYEGMLAFASSPDYVAVVMGHEMAHAIAKHGNERMSQQTALNMVGSVASEVIGESSGMSAQTLFNIGFGVGSQVGFLLPYSRKHELEADRIGLYLMALAGYDINAAPTFWEQMMENNMGAGGTDFFSTHPSDIKRVKALREALKDAEKFVGYDTSLD